MKTARVISIFLGTMSLSFGALKFVDPFKGWYSVQIASSGLPGFAFYLGIAGELTTGIIFVLPFLLSVGNQRRLLLLTLANSSLIIAMTVATTVHLLPEVPASVLPLKIKSPIIPLTFLTMVILNQMNVTKRCYGLDRPNKSLVK
jgi:hypothetical protein